MRIDIDDNDITVADNNAGTIYIIQDTDKILIDIDDIDTVIRSLSAVRDHMLYNQEA